ACTFLDQEGELRLIENGALNGGQDHGVRRRDAPNRQKTADSNRSGHIGNDTNPLVDHSAVEWYGPQNQRVARRRRCDYRSEDREVTATPRVDDPSSLSGKRAQ